MGAFHRSAYAAVNATSFEESDYEVDATAYKVKMTNLQDAQNMIKSGIMSFVTAMVSIWLYLWCVAVYSLYLVALCSIFFRLLILAHCRDVVFHGRGVGQYFALVAKVGCPRDDGLGVHDSQVTLHRGPTTTWLWAVYPLCLCLSVDHGTTGHGRLAEFALFYGLWTFDQICQLYFLVRCIPNGYSFLMEC